MESIATGWRSRWVPIASRSAWAIAGYGVYSALARYSRSSSFPRGNVVSIPAALRAWMSWPGSLLVEPGLAAAVGDATADEAVGDGRADELVGPAADGCP